MFGGARVSCGGKGNFSDAQPRARAAESLKTPAYPLSHYVTSRPPPAAIVEVVIVAGLLLLAV